MDNKISEYFSHQKSPQKEALEEFRKFIIELLPSAEEYLGYGVPAFRQNNKSIYYAVFKKHLGFYPGAEMIEKFKDDLKNYETSKGTIKFPLDKNIPYSLVSKIIKANIGYKDIF